MRAIDDILEQGAVGDRARQRPGVAVPVEIERRIVGIAAIGRLVADDAAHRRRDADRAADIRAGGQRRRAGGKAGAGAAGGTAGGVFRVPGRAGDALEPRIGDAAQENSGRRRARMHDHAAGLQVRSLFGEVVSGTKSWRQFRADRWSDTLDVALVLDRRRQSIERARSGAASSTCLGVAGLVERFVIVLEGEGLDASAPPLRRGRSPPSSVRPATASVPRNSFYACRRGR